MRSPEIKVTVKCPDCGKERQIRKARESSKVCKACAHIRCCSREKRLGSLNPAWRGTEHIPKTKYGQWKAGAEKRGHEWDLTIEALEALYVQQRGRCALTGAPLVVALRSQVERHEVDPDAVVSLDRIDSSRGYVPGNVQLVSWATNRAKSDLSSSAFAALCRSVAASHCPPSLADE
jgi:hypothetical protein